MAKAASNTPPTIKIKVVTTAQFSSAGPLDLFATQRRRGGQGRDLAESIVEITSQSGRCRQGDKLAKGFALDIP
jgi:hypothetical protein